MSVLTIKIYPWT